MTVLTVMLPVLLHLLVFTYWLGGDLGAFVASSIVSDAKRPAPQRAIAARILMNVDMAPRTALILALPTGVQLAASRGWIAVDTTALVALWIVSLAWLAVVWKLHLSHAASSSLLKKADLTLRWLLLLTLVITASLGFTQRIELPLFIEIKLLILAAALLCGLAIRRMLEPFGRAFAELMKEGPSDATNATISRCLASCRPVVILIWVLVIAAAMLGLARLQ